MPVKPINVRVDNAELAHSLARPSSARWIDDPVGGEWSYGAPVPYVRRLCKHWLSDFDWRSFESRINREEQLSTDIGDITIHAMLRRSTRAGALAGKHEDDSRPWVDWYFPHDRTAKEWQ